MTGHHGEQFDGYLYPGIDLTFVKEQEPLGTGGALWNAQDDMEEEFILLWGDDYHPIEYAPLVKMHREASSKLTMTVTAEHDEKNLQYVDGRLVQYAKDEDVPDEFNGYEAGTSVVKKAVVQEFGKEGHWSWEKTVYPTMSDNIHVHLDNTKFWDMGTPERLARLEEFLNKSRS